MVVSEYLAGKTEETKDFKSRQPVSGLRFKVGALKIQGANHLIMIYSERWLGAKSRCN
jgi:hypothetical protein